MTQSDARPNIVLIMTDQQRGDCLGCDGHPVLETPNLDYIASQGTRFTRAYSATPSCIPARASLLTGMDQWHTGILGMGRGQGPIPDNLAHTIPGELARAGYHTQAIGKNHFAPQRALNGYHNCILDESGRAEPGFKSDYRAWFEQHRDGPYGYQDHGITWNSWMARPSHLPEHLHPTWWTAQQGIDWLDRRDPNKPFFLKLSFARPHSPYDPPAPYYEMYRDRPMPQPPIGDWADLYAGACNELDPDAWRSIRKTAEVERARACYYGSITFIDHQIGRFLQALRKHRAKLADNTMIVFLSDHGDMLGDHHLWRKTYAYEGSARIPLILQPPRNWNVPRGVVCNEVVELRDIMPTLLSAVGLPMPSTCDGLDMNPLLRGETAAWRPFLHGEHFVVYSEHQAMQYLTDGREKYIYLPYLGREQLFDLDADPMELHDLAGDPAAAGRVRLWRDRLIQQLEARDVGLTRNGELVKLPAGAVIRSPHYRQYGIRADA